VNCNIKFNVAPIATAKPGEIDGNIKWHIVATRLINPKPIKNLRKNSSNFVML